MQRQDGAVLVHGGVGGLIAGLVVALWFLILDVTAGQPLQTPEALARVFFAGDAGVPGARLVGTYTLLHFGVYALLGAVVAAFIRGVNAAPGLLVGLAVGLGLLNAVHYGALLVTGARILTVLPPYHVLAANFAAGIGMMTYLHYALAPEAPFGLTALRRHRLVTEGLVAGLIGAAAVAVWFLLVDIVRGAPFFTPAALGSAVFLGAESAGQVQVTPGIVAAYTMVHLAAFGAVGIALVAAAEWLERAPSMWLMALMGFVILGGLFLAVASSVAAWLLGALGWWAVGAGNLLAVAAMLWRVWGTHPELRRKLLEQPVETSI